MATKLTSESARGLSAAELERHRREGGNVLYSISVLFAFNDYSKNEVRKWEVHNRFAWEVMEFRRSIFDCGFFMEEEPGSGYVIPPWDIKNIYVRLQRPAKGSNTAYIQ